MVDNAAARIAEAVWPNVADALGLGAEARGRMPAWRVVKEKRATFAATARQEERRPGSETALAENVALAGDWTDTGLPATIEGAIRSGRAAADFVLTL
jgi:hydroxysqualene dehydroxylase